MDAQAPERFIVYTGDDKLRAYTQKHKKRRSSDDNDDGRKKVMMGKHNAVTEVTYDSFKKHSSK